MSDENKHNLIYFENNSMKELYQSMEEWQHRSGKRLLSTNIQKDAGKFYCIALSNPSEVIICNGSGYDQVSVSQSKLWTEAYRP